MKSIRNIFAAAVALVSSGIHAAANAFRAEDPAKSKNRASDLPIQPGHKAKLGYSPMIVGGYDPRGLYSTHNKRRRRTRRSVRKDKAREWATHRRLCAQWARDGKPHAVLSRAQVADMKKGS